jgi:hypothetical protein
LGEDFVKAIETTVARCDVLIGLIGKNWITSKDDQGNRRLDNPEDFVRMEIGAALKRGIRVIPVLVDGAMMPRPADLPDDLKPLVRRQALAITDTSFDGDCQRLVANIKQILEEAETEQQERAEKKKPEPMRQPEEKARVEKETGRGVSSKHSRSYYYLLKACGIVGYISAGLGAVNFLFSFLPYGSISSGVSGLLWGIGSLGMGLFCQKYADHFKF